MTQLECRSLPVDCHFILEMQILSTNPASAMCFLSELFCASQTGVSSAANMKIRADACVPNPNTT